MSDWLVRILNTPHSPLPSEGEQIGQLQRLAIALAQDVSLQQMAELVTTECQAALRADAICTYLLKSNSLYEMITQRGCTPEFITQYKIVPSYRCPLSGVTDANEALFFGSAAQFKLFMPDASELVEKAGRQTVGCGSLIVNGHSIGLLGFSYNTVQAEPENKDFILLLMNVCAQALARAILSEQERAARREAEAANRAKTEFLANVSHEIRTPLGLIQGYTDLLFEAEGLNHQQRHWASIVRRNTRQLTNIIGEVLDISKIEADKIEIDEVLFSLQELIEDVKTTAELGARENGIALRFLCQEIPDQITSDPTRVRQIFLNLIGNAIKFTPKGTVEVYVRWTKPSRLEVLVKDSGIGIAPEHHLEIFKPFVQADATTSRRFGGTGLGLAISKQVAEALGGEVILVRSQPGEGSIFRFAMNCKPGVQPAGALSSGRIAASKPLEGIRILLVEDSIDNQELVAHILRAQGAEVESAQNGLNGIEMALKRDYDMVLMDIQMPELDGHEAVRILREKGFDRPIAALTAHALTSEKERSLREGFDEYLTKPIDPVILVGTVKRLAELSQVH